MNINGYKLREALKFWNAKRDATLSIFEGSLTKFKGEKKKSPDEIMKEFLDVEEAIAELQEEQMRYNISVIVKVRDKEMTLASAIKRIGGVGRVEKIWKIASKPVIKSRYGHVESKIITSKDKDTEYAERQVSFEEALERASVAGRDAAAYREAIAIGNGREIKTSLSPDLFGEETGA